MRRNAAWAIGELTNMLPGDRSDAVPQLITLLSDSDDWVRMAAARALGELHDRRSLTQLVATLSDNNWRVRELVVWALSETKNSRAVTHCVAYSCRILALKFVVERPKPGRDPECASSSRAQTRVTGFGPGISAKAAWAISEIEG